MQEAETALWWLSDARLRPAGAKNLKGEWTQKQSFKKNSIRTYKPHYKNSYTKLIHSFNHIHTEINTLI